MTAKIPTNIITGFLGAGKTTAIRHLLATRPKGERWAVLVNEFGEVGIDGALLEDGNTHIREVPGGCMCCVADLPTRVALNRLITRSRPRRLIIEPTGLGHPAEIIDTLSGEYYRDVLELRAVTTLVDPRRLEDARYRDNRNFRDQVALADVLVASKTDLCEQSQLARFEQWAKDFGDKQHLGFISGGELDPAWLDLPHRSRPGGHVHHHPGEQAPPALRLAPGETFTRRENHGDGHAACGWLFAATEVFDFRELFVLFNGIDALRLKGVMITDRGVFSFNGESGVLTVHELDDTMDSRVEIINDTALDWRGIEVALLNARF